MEIDNEVILDLISRLQEQAERNRYGCPINIIYVASGAQHVDTIQHQHNYYGEQKKDGPTDYTDEEQMYPALGLLCQLVKKAVEAGKQAKYILMPQRAAIEAEVMLPQIDAEWYNSRFGTNLNKMDLSRWINGTGKCMYTPQEIAPIIARFKSLK